MATAPPSTSITEVSADPSRSGLRHTLKRRHMQMIAFGGVIGAGLFVGSGLVVKSAGPAAIVSFALTGTLVVLVMRMLGEMAVAYPAIGGFYEYNRLALGELAGFLTGWMYWYFWVMVVAMEAVAGAGLIKYWFPAFSPWILTLALILTFTLLNLLSVRSWGEAEYWFASIKVAAITVFLCIGAAVILGLWPGAPAGVANLTAHGGFTPNGITPVLTGAVAATGFYFGAEIVVIAAAESVESERAVARATQSVISRVLVFYIGSIFIVVTLLPWNDSGVAQPYVSALRVLRVPGAADIMNGVILTAVLSALNSGLYASSRMLMALARRGDAPHALAKLNSRGVPVLGIVTGTLFGYFAVVMSYESPRLVFAFLVNSYGTVAIFVYVLIAVAQLRLRARLEREAPERLRLKMWGYPYLTILAIAAMLCILTAMAFIREQRVPLVFGVLSAIAMLGGYLARRRFGPAGAQASAGLAPASE
ncbi:MAG TPA: amino acid permease [Steroidobacteraceae bacterium]|nr:amino acid permease [Steroidobacteraceae bacterium]